MPGGITRRMGTSAGNLMSVKDCKGTLLRELVQRKNPTRGGLSPPPAYRLMIGLPQEDPPPLACLREMRIDGCSPVWASWPKRCIVFYILCKCGDFADDSCKRRFPYLYYLPVLIEMMHIGCVSRWDKLEHDEIKIRIRCESWKSDFPALKT